MRAGHRVHPHGAFPACHRHDPPGDCRVEVGEPGPLERYSACYRLRPVHPSVHDTPAHPGRLRAFPPVGLPGARVEHGKAGKDRDRGSRRSPSLVNPGPVDRLVASAPGSHRCYPHRLLTLMGLFPRSAVSQATLLESSCWKGGSACSLKRACGTLCDKRPPTSFHDWKGTKYHW